jgi:hypothetical protein
MFILLLISLISIACHEENEQLADAIITGLQTPDPADRPPTVEGVLEKKYAGRAQYVQYFWDGENSCESEWEATLTFKKDDSAELIAIGKGFTYGKGGCMEDVGNLQVTITGKISGGKTYDDPSQPYNTIEFDRCNGDVFDAKGSASIQGPPGSPAVGLVTCYWAKDGEIDTELTFTLEEVP